MANILTFTPDNFAGDWYGWVTNQCGHALLVGGYVSACGALE